MAVLGETSGWVWTRQQALAGGMTPAAVATALRRGEWQTAWPGVHADAGAPLDAEQRALAAVMASGGAGQPLPIPGAPGRRRLLAVACGRTAARVHGLVLVDDADPATGAQQELLDHVSTWTGGPVLRQVQPDGRVRLLRRHQLALGPGEVLRRGSGLYVTSPLRTVADCAALLAPEALVCLLDDALRRGVVTTEGLADLVARRSWCTGAVRLRTAVRLADGRAESPAETLARLLLRPVLPGLVPQVRVHDARGHVVARLDLGDEALRLAVEADGRAGHAGTAMVAKDRRRDRTTGALGWRTERFTWFDLRRRQSEVVQIAVEAAREQAVRHGRTWPYAS